MSLGTLLQTIIAVIFIYLILSLLASEIQEYIASIAEFRAKRLKESIKQLLGEERQESSLTNLLYDKYLIPSLNQSATSIFSYIFSILPFSERNRRNRKSKGPSYIEPKLFAQALLQIINEKIQNVDKKNNGDNPTIGKLKRADNIDEVINKFEGIKANSDVTNEKVNSDAVNKLVQIASELKLEKDNPKLYDFQAKLEELFEETQVRSSGVYKRNAKGFSFVLGLIIAIIANADPFYIVGNLSKNNNDFRDRVVNKLDENQEQLFSNRTEEDAFGEDEKELVRNIIDEVGTLPLGWNYDREIENKNLNSLIEIFNKNNMETCPDEDSEDNQASEKEKCFNQFLEDIENQPYLGAYIRQDQNENAKQLIKELNYIENCLESQKNIDTCLQNKQDKEPNYDFPTTYTTYRQNLRNQQLSQRIDNIKTRNKIDFGNQIKKQGGWLQVSFGWVISAIAISMGAPFWFDLLGKVMNVRNTKKSQKTDSIDSTENVAQLKIATNVPESDRDEEVDVELNE